MKNTIAKSFAIVTSSVVAFFVAASFASAAYDLGSVTLKVGSTGMYVSNMQSALNACGASVSVDGNFGPMTKGAVMAFQSSHSLTADGLVGNMTKAALNSCGSSSSNNGGSTTLSGGAGDLTLSSTSTDVENDLKEGEEDVKILGIEAEADGSDIAITNIKVTFRNEGYNAGDGSSERFDKYVDEVKIFLGDEEVGSADADEFSRESGSPDEFSKTISVSGLVIDEDEEEKIYVAVSGASTIDEDDREDASWDIEVNTVRFNDATGAILSADIAAAFDDFASDDNDFTFESSDADDSLELKSSSANPSATTLKVDEDADSDDHMVLAAKLEVDDDSSDITLNELTVLFAFDDPDFASTAATADDIIKEVVVEIDGEEFDADLSTGGNTNADDITDFGATYIADIDGDVTIDAGDVVDVKVFVTFNDQDGNYGNETVMKAKITTAGIEAEGDDELSSIDGSDRTSNEHTLSTSVASLSGVSWSVSNGGSLIDFIFTVEAEDEDVDIEIADIIAVDSIDTNGSVATPTVTKITGDATGTVDDYVVESGDTAKFRVRYAFSGTNGEYANVTITHIAGQEVDEDDQISPTAVLNLN